MAAARRLWIDRASRVEPRLVLGGLAMEVRTQQSGRLEDVSPLDLLQSLGIYRRAGHVLFFHAHGQSQLWFEAGEIVDARAGALHGAAAVYRIVTHDRGSFRVEVTGEARSRVLERSGSALIFEAARRLDEGQRLRARLPAAESVLASVAAVSESCGSIEAYVRVAALFEGGATLGEVLERSPLGELETLQRVAELVEAGQLGPTGAVRSPELSMSDGLGERGPWPLGLEVSQPFVPSPSFASHEDHEGASVVRRRWWIHASVGAVVAAIVTLVLVRGSGEAQVADAAAPVIVATAPAVQPREGETGAATRERALVVGASAATQELARDDRAELAQSPVSSTTSTTKAAREPVPRARSRPELAPAEQPAPRRVPAAKPDDATSLLAEARRAYASGQGASAHRLASRSQRMRPSDDAAELIALAACQMQRPDVAHEALRAVPLLRRGSVRSTCKQEHGVRLKVGRGGR